MRILEITAKGDRFESALLNASWPPEGAEWFDPSRLIERKKISPAALRPLSERIDAAVLLIPFWPQLHLPFPNRNPLKNLPSAPGALLYYLKYARLLAFWRRLDCPRFVFDFLDAPVLDPRWHPFADCAVAVFKRELPRTLANVFLYTSRVAVEPWRNEMRFSRLIKKLRPVSLGVPDRLFAEPLQPQEKTIDLLWAGNLNACNPVRQRGFDLLKRAAQTRPAFKILDEKIPLHEYQKLAAASRLVWSPEGAGWQCYKHYEIMALGTVPVISCSWLWQADPLEDGEHCFYYDPEGDGLLRVVENALRDEERLRRISRKAYSHALRTKSETMAFLRALESALPPGPR